MAADATAAGVYMGLVKNADPIGAYTAGVQLQANLQKISLAGQAQQIDTILNVVKMQNENADNRRRNELAEKQLAISTFNAETARMNALRPRATSTSAAGGSIWDIMGVDEKGFYFKGPEAQGPTEGEGDGPEMEPVGPAGDISVLGAASPSVAPAGGNNLGTHVPGYDPFGMSMSQQAEAQNERQRPQGSLLPPGGGGSGGSMDPDPSMQLPHMPGQPAPTSAKGGRIYFDIDNINVNAKGQPSMSLKRRGAGADELAPIPTPQQLAALSAPFAHLGKRAVPDANNKRGYVFEDIPTLSGVDLSISTLPADTQKELLTDVKDMIKLGGKDGPDDVAKMEAMGVVVERDEAGEPTPEGIQKAGQEMIDKKLSWSEAFTRAQKKNDNELIAKAATYALKLNASMEGKKGWQTKTALDVINDIGLKVPASLFTPEVAQGQQPGARSVSVAQAGQGGDNVEMAAVTAKAAPVDENTQLRRDEQAGQIQLLQNEIATLPKGSPERTQKESFLASLQRQQAPAVKPGRFMTPDKAPEAPATSGKWKAEPTQQESPQVAKRNAAQQAWEAPKKVLFEKLPQLATKREAETMRSGDPTYGDEQIMPSAQGKSAPEARKEWLSKNADKLGLKDIKGNTPTMESVMFIDHTGREIKMKEVLEAALEDPRMWKDDTKIEGQAPSGKQITAVKVVVGKPEKK